MGCDWGRGHGHGCDHVGFRVVPDGVRGWPVLEVEVDWHEA